MKPKALFFSTPSGKNNAFYEMFEKRRNRVIIENAKAVFCIIDFGYRIQGMLIGHSGGEYGDGCNIWLEEAENSTDIDDIFWDNNDKKKPEEAGFWVWEGKIEPVYDDAPNYTGEWRKATPEDIIGLFPEESKLIKALDSIDEFYKNPENG